MKTEFAWYIELLLIDWRYGLRVGRTQKFVIKLIEFWKFSEFEIYLFYYLRWTSGFNGHKSFMVDESHLVYACGASLKCLNVQSGELKTYQPFHHAADANAVHLLTASSLHGALAFCDTQTPPHVYVHETRNFHRLVTLKGCWNLIVHFGKFYDNLMLISDGAMLEFIAIEFSNGEALFTLSGIPDLQIIIW